MQIWINAWLFSAVLCLGIYVFARRTSLPRFESGLISIAAFPSPLFVAIGGPNSFVYSVDLIAPFAIWAGCAGWRVSSRRIRAASISLLVSLGVCPIVIAVIFSGTRIDLLYNCINLYRLSAALGLLIRFNASCVRGAARTTQWVHAFSWIAVVIAVAMAAQYFGVSSDVFGKFLASNFEEGGRNDFFNVLGLFRGSLGILGALAVCADLANTVGSIASRLFTATGAVCGLAVILLTGSKTSLVVVLLVAFGSAAVIGIKRASEKAIVYIALVSVVFLGTSGIPIPEGMNDFVSSGGQAHDTLDSREDMWRSALDSIKADPLILLGAAQPSSMPELAQSSYVPGAYHDEFVAVVMLGGVYSLALYGMGLAILFVQLWRGCRGAGSGPFAFLCLSAGLLHSLSVAHIQPTLLFGSVSCLLLATYGLGAGVVNRLPLPERPPSVEYCR